MIRRPPRSTPTDTLFPYTTLFRSIGATSAAMANTTLNASIWFPETQPLTRYGYQEWAKKVEQRSNGDLKIKVFTDTTLLPVVAHLSGLRDGIADIPYHAGTYTPADIRQEERPVGKECDGP